MDPRTSQRWLEVRSHQDGLLAEASDERLIRRARSRAAPQGARFAPQSARFADTLRRAERVLAGLMARLRPEHSLTSYRCRLPNGRMGRVAAVVVDGEWTLVCKVAPMLQA
jgi:hypothetical protein